MEEREGKSGEDEDEGEIKERPDTDDREREQSWIRRHRVITLRLRAVSLSHFMGPVLVVDTNILPHKRGAVGWSVMVI